MLLYNSTEETDINKQQWIFPSMKFSCGGNITKWTFVARSQPDKDCDQYLRFELWIHSTNTTGRYERMYQSSVISTMSNQSEFVVEEYTPGTPVPFEAGYIFGLYQPQESRRRLRMVYVDVPPGYGYDNYFRSYVMMSLEEFDTDGSLAANNYPLVAVNTSEYQKTLAL